LRRMRTTPQRASGSGGDAERTIAGGAWRTKRPLEPGPAACPRATQRALPWLRIPPHPRPHHGLLTPQLLPGLPHLALPVPDPGRVAGLSYSKFPRGCGNLVGQGQHACALHAGQRRPRQGSRGAPPAEVAGTGQRPGCPSIRREHHGFDHRVGHDGVLHGRASMHVRACGRCPRNWAPPPIQNRRLRRCGGGLEPVPWSCSLPVASGAQERWRGLEATGGLTPGMRPMGATSRLG